MVSNLNLINYVDVCSKALLAIIDNNLYSDVNGVYKIDLSDKDVKQSICYYVESFIKAEYHFGMYNVVINTCRPSDNWRKVLRGSAIKASKYRLVDENIELDLPKLEKLLDNTWKQLQAKMENFIWISHYQLDIFDLVLIMQKVVSDNINLPQAQYIILTDENNDYVHYNDIDSKYVTDIEMILRQNRVIQ